MSLIDYQDVVENTKMDGNTDPDNWQHLLNDAEIMILEVALGTKLYDKIVTDYNDDNPNNLSGDYLLLYNKYIRPVLWHSVYAMYLREGNVIAANGGIFTHKPENAEPAKLEDIQYAAKAANSKVDMFIERMEVFLCEVNLPEYDDDQDNDYDINPQDVQTQSGWHLDGNPRQGRTYSRGSSGGNYIELE